MPASIIPPSDSGSSANRSHGSSSARSLPASTARGIAWTAIFPFLVRAYKQGYGIQEPKSEELKPVQGPICSCANKSLKTVTCIFKCGKEEKKMFREKNK